MRSGWRIGLSVRSEVAMAFVVEISERTGGKKDGMGGQVEGWGQETVGSRTGNAAFLQIGCFQLFFFALHI